MINQDDQQSDQTPTLQMQDVTKLQAIMPEITMERLNSLNETISEIEADAESVESDSLDEIETFLGKAVIRAPQISVNELDAVGAWIAMKYQYFKVDILPASINGLEFSNPDRRNVVAMGMLKQNVKPAANENSKVPCQITVATK